MCGSAPLAREDSVRPWRLSGAFGRLRNLAVRGRMRSFAGAFPELAFDLSLELRGTSRADLARDLEACTVKAVSYDPETDVGLVALEPQRALNAVERNVVGQKLGQVIRFSDTPYASLQLDNFGRVIAIELVAPPTNLRWILRPASQYRWKGS